MVKQTSLQIVSFSDTDVLKVVDTSPPCEKDCCSVCLHSLHLSLPSECIYSFWKLLILEP